MPSTWLILEDNANRIAAFKNAASSLSSEVDVRLWCAAPPMLRELPALLQQAAVVSLDHDLYKQSERDPDPGCGRDVANFLARQKPHCPVIIHSSNAEAAWGMYNELTFAGWQVEMIHHLDEPDWIQARWLAVVQRLTGG